MRALQIIEAGYRGTLEEQDDTIIWLTHAMKGIDADISVLLCGNAVNYILVDQAPPMLQFGNWVQTQATDIEGDLVKLIDKDVEVYVVKEDLKSRGLINRKNIGGIKLIDRNQLPSLLEKYEQLWHW
ncbi:MAG: hypothetical protein HND53_05455 [Proteobacteria bacterium]|nr:hypothetical protein [Pseudomonadota bacterium]NOG59928.1 hypothetical protein [Pseudomonadota bacterium]